MGMPGNIDKEARRDASIHNGSYLTGNAPRPIEGSSLTAKRAAPDVSETGMPKIMESLRRFGIDPTKPLEKTEGGEQK